MHEKNVIPSSLNSNENSILSDLMSQIEVMPASKKGREFELYVAELYRGNGYLARVVGGKGDGGADIIISHPDHSDEILKIIQVKNTKRPLSYDCVRTELRKFEEVSSKIFKCSSFGIVSMSGYSDSCYQLERYNITLDDKDFLFSMISSFSTDEGIKPKLLLMGHNQETYRKLKESLANGKSRAAVIQATGTGKRYIIGQYMLDNLDKKILFLSPSHHINIQQQSVTPSKSINAMTYAGVLSDFRNNQFETDYDAIILDEYHRVGADEWGKAVSECIVRNPNAQVIGFTATPTRTDTGVDMTKEMFEGNDIANISLCDAIARKILPEPTYISGIYTALPILEDKRKEAGKHDILIDAHKKAFDEELRMANVNWENAHGVDKVLDRHIDTLEGKYIVFCESIEHMFDTMDDVSKWFRKACKKRGQMTTRISSDYIHSKQSRHTSSRIIESFEAKESSKEISLLFSVNMLNEGLHISGVDRVILLRNTSSLNVYLQQIGRCLSANSDTKPLILDLVNNLNNISSISFKKSIESSVKKENIKRGSDGLEPSEVEFTIYDMTVETKKLVESINVKSFTWDTYYNLLLEFKKQHGHLRVKHSFVTDGGAELWKWCEMIRLQARQKKLSKKKVEQLNKIDFIWCKRESTFLDAFALLEAYVEEHGNAQVHESHVTECGFPLGQWLRDRRHDYRVKVMEAYRIGALERLGVQWGKTRHTVSYEDRIIELKAFVKEFGHANVPAQYKTNTGSRLGRWVDKMRQTYRNGKMSDSRIAELNSINFIWHGKKKRNEAVN
ncbi:hypothetical protein VCHA53O466_40041 [Vibrio chagasii]|nr:hypothetical protein VCHA53O466_40041 [Vibrio chagasii]